MALIGNYSVLSKDPGRSIGGGAIGLGNNRSDFNKPSQARGAFCSEYWDPLSGIPDGYRDPYWWVMPITAGALAARKNVVGDGDLTGAVAGGVNGECVIAGVGDLSGVGQLIISMAATISGSGTISGAALQAFLQLAAALSGSGGATAQLTAIGHLAAAVEAEGTVAGTTVLTALGTLAAAINVTGDVLTTANVASAILDAVDGVEDGLTVRHALRLIAAATAGKISGAATTTITIRNAFVDDKDRIIATVTADGDRTAITYDLTDS
jgi:hypothetical protein